jgi:hypothetical protein
MDPAANDLPFLLAEHGRHLDHGSPHRRCAVDGLLVGIERRTSSISSAGAFATWRTLRPSRSMDHTIRTSNCRRTAPLSLDDQPATVSATFSRTSRWLSVVWSSRLAREWAPVLSICAMEASPPGEFEPVPGPVRIPPMYGPPVQRRRVDARPMRPCNSRSDGAEIQRSVRKKSLYPGDTSDINRPPEIRSGSRLSTSSMNGRK